MIQGDFALALLFFIKLCMQSIGHYILTITSFARQLLNCWLEYALSQPVDLDISVMFYFLRSYVGADVLFNWVHKNTAIVAEDFSEDELKETMTELLTQESYS
jgi:hypothetical protein